MNKDIFWAMIEKAKTVSAGNLEMMATNLKEQLLELTIDEVIDFDHILHSYMSFSYKNGLWSIASIIKDHCTDDGFEDFRLWLIAQGKEAYFAALKNPDTLADLEITHDDVYGTAEFCDLRYLAPDVYEIMTGAEIWTQDFSRRYREMKMSLESGIEYMDDIDKWIETSDVLTCFPKIVKKYIGPDFI